jgi:dephospho-CoA kinase
MPLVIALTGGIGSGKSSVAAILKELGAAVVDTDEISHQLTAPGKPGAGEISARFGPEYLRPDGALDRDRMRKRIFSDPAAKQALEAILHPMIRTEAHAAVHAAQAPYVVIAVPLLIETGAYLDLAHRILVVDCEEEQQIARVIERSRLSPAEVKSIMTNQASRAERLKRADDIVPNNADLATLRSHVTALHRKYLALARARENRRYGAPRCEKVQ